MELTIAVAISILGAVMTVVNFVMARKDKSVDKTAEHQKQFSKHDLIEYRLDKIEKQLEKILEKLDLFDKEVDDKIKKAIEHHEAQLHK